MNLKKLGKSELNITPIGFGAWAIGGQWEWGWGAQEDKQSIRTIHAALDSGINWIDTAPVYGCGHSEEVIGQALKQTSAKPYIFTKCGFRWNDKREVTPLLTSESVREEVENSLRRMAIETIDLYQIHWPNPESQIEEAFETMVALQKEGKIRYLGVSNFSTAQMDRISSIGQLTSLQPPYNAIARSAEEDVLPYCHEQGIGTIVYSPMASGLLTGKMTRERLSRMADDDWRKKAPQFNEPELTTNLRIAKVMGDIAAEKGCNTTEVAIAWTLHNKGVTGAIVGMRSEEQVAGVIGSGRVLLSESEMNRIKGAASA